MVLPPPAHFERRINKAAEIYRINTKIVIRFGKMKNEWHAWLGKNHA
jgi:hypothetical protein